MTQKNIRRTALGGMITLAFVALLLLIGSGIGIEWLTDGIAAARCMLELSAVLLTSISLSLNLRCNRFDFSLGGVAMLAPLLAWHICPSPVAGGLLSCFFGALLSLCVCGAYTALRITPELASLCAALVFEGIAVSLSDAADISPRPTLMGAITVATVSIAVSFFIHVLLEKTPFGYDYRAICISPHISRSAGVSIELNSLTVYAISGALAGGVGVLLRSLRGTEIVGINFSSVRMLFFALLPIFVGKLMERLCPHVLGLFYGSVICSFFYSFMRELDMPQHFRIIVISAAVLMLLLYLSNEKRIKQKLLPSK